MMNSNNEEYRLIGLHNSCVYTMSDGGIHVSYLLYIGYSHTRVKHVVKYAISRRGWQKYSDIFTYSKNSIYIYTSNIQFNKIDLLFVLNCIFKILFIRYYRINPKTYT